MTASEFSVENHQSDFAHLFAILDKYANEAKGAYKARLLSDDKKASGKLIDSISTNVSFADLTFTVTMELADYWHYVEHGRKPGKWPPRGKIHEWIRLKPVIPYPQRTGKLPTQEQLAFLIARKIGTQGIEAGNQLADTLESLNQQYIPLLQKALEEDWNSNHAIKVLDVVNNSLKVVG